ncbi:MAG: hypothetical protein ACE5FU_06455, partial [Nitrospinota bacterium]
MLNGVFATRFSAFFILLLVSSRLLWPGDSSFINDEPRLLEMALEQNSSGKLYSLGLMGSKGVQYGPVPIWYYRFLLVLTHDILLVSFINTLCITTLTLFGAVKLVREIRDLGPSLVSLVFLSPFLWFYSRNMWDNSLNIPVVLLGFSFYLAFHRKKDTLSLSVTFLMLVISLQIHLMAIPFAASILAHFFIFNLRWVREHKGKFFLLSAFSFAASLPYLKYLATTAETHSTAQTDLTSFLFPFLGADFFSAHNFSYFLGEKWQNS